jgi:hypothetical protein
MRFSLFFFAIILSFPVTASAHLYLVPSPTHRQTFTFGSEHHQAWQARGRDRHLALAAEFTNDPFVDQVDPREDDDFTFDFPDVRLGADGRTFYYHPGHGRDVPVAVRYKDFLGLDEVRLLDNAVLLMKKPHGYLSLALVINDRAETVTASL